VLAVGIAVAVGLSSGELRLGVGVLCVDVAMLATLIPLRRAHALSARELGLRPTAPAPAVGLVALSAVVIAIIDGIWNHGILQQPVTPLLATLHESTAAKMLGGFAAVLCAPVIEEIFFRGLLYRALRNRMSVARAALLGGVLFGLVHATTYPLDSLPPKMVFGVIACLLYEYTGSLYPSIALHSFIDATTFEIAISGHDRVVVLVFLVLGALFVLYARIRHLRPTSKEVSRGVG
jgi:membrane protease YdiL (CAAX protease family)